MSKLNNNYIATVDIGNAKVVCFIARIEASGSIEILGIGHQVAQGFKSGNIIDIKLAEKSISSAIAAAEKMAQINVDSVTANIAGSHQTSNLIKAESNLISQSVSGRDINRLIMQACEKYKDRDLEVIHCVPIEYFIDGTGGIKNPVGMYGHKLQAVFHVITASSTAINNITNCLASCHLDVEDFISSGYASGMSCLKEDERKLGVTLIDIGSGNISIAIFKNDNIIYTSTIAVGGSHITNDIAMGLSTNIESAERIKNLYGNIFLSPKDEREMIDIPQLGEDGNAEMVAIERSSLPPIISPRVEEIFEMINNKLDSSPFARMGGNIVITGGSSQLSGIKELAEQVFTKQVRIGRPEFIEGMAESTKGPAFSTCAGMLQLVAKKLTDNNFTFSIHQQKPTNSFSRALAWVKENF